MKPALAKIPIGTAEDVFALRQAGRIAAHAVGCEEADQVRFATALSELGREAIAHGAQAVAVFSLEPGGVLAVEIDGFRSSVLADTAMAGLEAARKLVGDVAIAPDAARHGRSLVVLRRPGTARPAPAAADDIRAALRRAAPPAPLEQLRLENHDLIATLEELKAKQDELVRLNAELEDTNRGVMAMYGQLADELEETNRGVVALYAELDDKSVRLNQASDAKSRFLASVSHELRGPLTSILGLARLLLDPADATLSPEQTKQLQLVHGSANELLGLVNQLLDLAKAESGRLEPDVTRVDLNDIFTEMRGAIRPLVPPGVALIVDPPDVAAIDSDRTLLTHVIRNLLTNAVKFTTSGSVRLSARSITPYTLRITVTDTGIGIAPDDQPRVFEEFFQVRGPAQAAHKGTGLGLPYARRVTETLGGTLTLESEIGRGSTFTVDMPVAWQPLLGAPGGLGWRDLPDLNVGSVVIVDDDDGFRAVLRGLLQNWVRNVHEARGGNEGLELMQSVQPDVAFIDLRMPDMDGDTVLARMNADPGLRTIPVVIATSVPLTTAVRTAVGTASALIAKSDVTRETVHVALIEALRILPADA